MKQLIEITKNQIINSREFWQFVGYMSWFGVCFLLYVVGIIWIDWYHDGVWLQNMGF